MAKKSQPDLFGEMPVPLAPDGPPAKPKRPKKAKTPPADPEAPAGGKNNPAFFAPVPRPWADSVVKNFTDYTPEDWLHVGIVRNERGGFLLRGRVVSTRWLPGDLRALGLAPDLQTDDLNLSGAVERGQLIEAAFRKNESGEKPKPRKGDDLAAKMSPDGALLA